MEHIGSFEIKRLSFGVYKIGENYYKISVPTMGTQRSAFHTAPNVFATMNGNEITFDGLPSYHKVNEEEIKNKIIELIRTK